MANSRNNVRKRGSTWTYYLYAEDGAGNRRQVSKGGFRTRREAEAARVSALESMQRGTWVRPHRLSLGAFLIDEWLPSQRPPTLDESTYQSYARNIRLHVIPYVGGVDLQQLTPMDLNQLYRTLLESGRRRADAPARSHPRELVDLVDRLRVQKLTWERVAEQVNATFDPMPPLTRHAVAALHRRRRTAEPKVPAPPGLSPRMVRYVHTIVHAALKDAMAWNRVARNVADACKPPSVGSTKRGRKTTWSAEQLGMFLEHVAENRYLPAWLFLATVGCRRGECLGLRWQDVDLDGATASLSRQVTSVDHRIIVKELPKTKRGHMVVLDRNTVAMLRRHRAQQNEEKLLMGAGYRDQGYVFCKPDGTVYDPDRFSREFDRKQHQYNRAHPDAALPRLTLHGLRHTWATLALREGIDIKVVSDRLNHSSTFVTREIYSHVTPPMQSDAAERVAARIFGSDR